ncbi:hydantoinase/oxoprolinase family protein [Stieleria marina]|uniref:Hydantoinase/oxoprolinase n=1 Tax=Stieleria marina TaxID=1930275 RepID=A0A517NQN9_9BACT|nr:Hydantoinase/oxoprolinase [Planctomycetes bacterium K23_9]
MNKIAPANDERSFKRTVGVDIGGANLKYVSYEDTEALASNFPMWRQADQLSDAMVKDVQQFGHVDSLAVTMTGELADCFVDRQQGVEHIVDHVLAMAQRLSISHVCFYGVDGKFHDAAWAVANADVIAAANWHALANYIGQTIRSDALLIDIGSTTTDLIPISAGQVATEAQTDHDRLVEGSLVYVGRRRTPVCGLVDHLAFRGTEATVMNEFFATIDDALIVLGRTEPLENDCDSADGKPRTIAFAANRLARMIGLDRRTVSEQDAQDLATQVVDAANKRIVDGITRLGLDIGTMDIVLSGHGPNLLNKNAFDLPGKPSRTMMEDIIGEAVCRAAPAFAVAALLAAQTQQNST